MKSSISDKSRKPGERRVVGILSRSKWWSVLIPLALQTIVTIGATECILIRNIGENTEHQIDRTLNNSDRQVFSRLNNYLENSQSTSSDLGQPLERELNNFLQQLESEFSPLDEVSIVDRDGSIVASSNPFPIIRLPSDLERGSPQKFILKTSEKEVVGQIAPLSNNGIEQRWSVVTAKEQSETETSTFVARRNKLRIQYLGWLLLTTVLGLLTYLWLRKRTENILDNTDLEATSMTGEAIAQQKPVIEESAKTSDIQSSLIANMSHELRSPLNAILGFGQIMQHSLTEKSQRENLAIINRSGKRLLSIINELVDLSKIEENRLGLERHSFDFYFWLDSIEQSIESQVREQNISFSLIRESGLSQYIALDELRLRQILRNLLDYSMGCSQDSTVKLRVFSTSLPSPTESQQIDLNFEIENASLAIAPAALSDLFDPLIQARQEWHSPQGSSLSLAVSHKLARLMGGDLTVSKSKLEPQRTIFRLNVRAEIATDGELEIQSTPREIVGLASDQPDYRILVVDDSKTNRKIMVQLLERVGFKVQEAVNGREAVEVWLRWQPHMIWMDLRMPVMNGYEATSQIRSRSATRSPAIIALTASTSEEERALFRESGCDDFVGKPFTENTIFEKVAQHLGVRYIYQNPPPASESFRLTADSLRVMSDSWLEQVEQAAACLDAELLTELLEEIPPEHSDLNRTLQQQVDDFNFGRIINLIEKSKSKSIN